MTRRSACGARSMRRRRAKRSKSRSRRTGCCAARASASRDFRSPAASRRSRCTGSRAMGAGCGCRSRTRPPAAKRTAVRYLYDTIKGADLGIAGTAIVLDFNFAYNPSVRLRRPLVVSAVATGEPLAVRGDGGRAGAVATTRGGRGARVIRAATRPSASAAINDDPRRRDTADRSIRASTDARVRPANRRALRCRRSIWSRAHRRSRATGRTCADRRSPR